MEEGKAVTVVPVMEMDKSPAGMMAMAVANNQDLVQLEKLLDLQIRWEANEAKKAYHQAMAKFKSNPPEIGKDRHVSFDTTKGTTSYNHASLFNVTQKINSALSAHGLSAAWKTAQRDGGMIDVTCSITHELGHSESTTLSASPDQSGGKNNIQAVGSTISYLQRYTLLSLTGLATKEIDDDGVGSEPVEFVAGEHLDELKALHKEVVSKPALFLKAAKIKSLEEIPVARFDAVMGILKQRKADMTKPTREPGSDDE